MKKTNPEILRYTKNSGSFWLCMLAIATDVLYFTGAFSPIMAGVPFEVGFVIAIDVIINILFMLFTFLCAEKLKAYQINWSYVALAMGIAQIVRIFIVPFLSYDVIEQQQTVVKYFMDTSTKVQCIIWLALSSASLIGASYIGYIKSKQLKAYLKEIEGGE